MIANWFLWSLVVGIQKYYSKISIAIPLWLSLKSPLHSLLYITSFIALMWPETKWYTKIHCFLALPFHMVWSVLLQVLAQKITVWLVEILYRPIRSSYLIVFEANTLNKMEHTLWKGIECCARKWCLFLCTILFEVAWAIYKMWHAWFLWHCAVRFMYTCPFSEEDWNSLCELGSCAFFLFWSFGLATTGCICLKVGW